ADYTELQRGSVDCVLISLPQWREDSLETLAVLHRVTRDTVILFSGFDTQGAAAAETKPCNALRQALDAIGFTSIGHHRLTPVAGSPCVHILRKQGPEAQRLNH
ncbi:hypothetical protein, partial [Pseudomonas citronellolis]|uniref:hypothetical protein n=1 Tax=Pseudomonas citronellolis TaxID=53408 RepID=UPI0023E3AA53